MSFILVGTGIAAVGAGANIIGGINKTSQGNRLAAGNVRPWYNIPSQYYQNDNLAASQAENGLPESTVNYYTTQAARGLGSGADAILQGGGDADSLAKLYDSFSQGLSSESAQDATLKNQHLNTFINANKDLAGQQTQQWALNYLEPYKDTAQLASALKAGGQQQTQTGIGEAVGAAATLSNDELYKGRTDAIGGGTIGNKLGLDNLSAASPIAGSLADLPGSSAGTNPLIPFTTPGGAAVMSSLGKTDAPSGQLQQLLQLLSKNSQLVN